MPSYVIEFDSNHGPERRLFTLDDDRTLQVQLYQVLEELNQSGRVLRGAPGDELAVSWNGGELDLNAPLHALGVDAMRPLVLYMRPRRIEATVIPPPVTAPFGLRHMVLPPVEGALGALVAWGLAGLVTDLRAPLTTVDRVDMMVGVLLAGCVGLALSMGSVMRGLYRVPIALVCALLSAATGALVLGGIEMAGAAPTAREFLLARVVTWLLVALPVALVATAPLRVLGGQRFAEAAVLGLVAGLLGALVASLPGLSDVWQAMAFILCGALVGAAAISIPIWRTVATSTSTVAVLLAAALLVTATPASGQPRGVQSVATPTAARPAPVLVRCQDGRAMACFQVTLPHAVGAGNTRDVDTSAAAWKAELGRTALIGPGLIRLGFDSTRAVRLLIAVDVSGSMRGEGIAFTRSALRTFVSALPSAGVEVAIVPFESQNVSRGFSRAAFAVKSQALKQLDAIPAPTSGNTALYSAVAEGLRELDRSGGKDNATVLLVLTDGINDVGHPTDDDGLLGGEEGRDEARRLISSTRHRVWLVGVGAGVNSAELGALAGDRASTAVVEMDPGALLSLLEKIRLTLATQYTLVYGIPSTAAVRMGRRPQRTVVHGDSTRLALWRPPLLARPLFLGAADSALLSSDVRLLTMSSDGAGGDRWIVGGALLIVLLSAYAVLWKLAGTGAAGGSATPVPAKPKAKRGTVEPLLRRDAIDAPPRAPTDITQDSAA